MKRYLSQGLICAILGFVLVLQVRTLTVKEAMAMAQDRNTDEIVSQLITVGKERDRLQEELRVMRDMASQAANHSRLQQQVRQDQAASGLAPVEGRGVIVSLGDARSIERVLVKDLLMVLNELRASGAEAIAVGGVRMTERTRITAASDQPMAIDNIPIKDQVIISAIGDPDVLAAGLLMRGGIFEELRNYFPVSVSPVQRLVIPAAAAMKAPTYARPIR
jgi:uncharacterized protein YlxW (UPF0749 family)